MRYCDVCLFKKLCKHAKFEHMHYCSRFKPETNVVWIHGLSDEELQKFLTKVADMCHYCGASKNNGAECIAKKNGYCAFCSTEVGEWLKDVHKEEKNGL